MSHPSSLSSSSPRSSPLPPARSNSHSHCPLGTLTSTRTPTLPFMTHPPPRLPLPLPHPILAPRRPCPFALPQHQVIYVQYVCMYIHMQGKVCKVVATGTCTVAVATALPTVPTYITTPARQGSVRHTITALYRYVVSLLCVVCTYVRGQSPALPRCAARHHFNIFFLSPLVWVVSNACDENPSHLRCHAGHTRSRKSNLSFRIPTVRPASKETNLLYSVFYWVSLPVAYFLSLLFAPHPYPPRVSTVCTVHTLR